MAALSTKPRQARKSRSKAARASLPKRRLMLGDCLERMKEIEDGSVDLTVTSPPYDNLRTYNGNLQWGEHVWKAIIQDLFRVTKQGGVVVWVVGDATVNGSESGTSFKQGLWAKECGFRLHDTMIFEKSNPIPLTHNRYEQKFEYMFVFSKGKPKTFNPLKEATKHGGKLTTYNVKVKEGAARRQGEKIEVKKERLRYNIWLYNVSSNDRGCHPAPFPEKLAQDHIVSWSNPDDMVLDPFMGSGTTGKIAKQLGRNFIGIEKDVKYFKLAKKRICLG